jgi:inositol phosphorylceramide mannosyltransferase catalytic subunit
MRVNIMLFPHIIHQIWLQGEENIPDKFNENIASIKNMHKSWTYYLWDEVKILVLLKKNKLWLETYYKLQYLHQKVDYARYIILYIYGGIYLDIDVMQRKPFDQLVSEYKNYDMIVSYLRVNPLESIYQCYQWQCINNGIIICKPRIKILENIINYIIDNYACLFLTNRITCIMTTTGPNMFTRLINQYNQKDKIKILENEYLEPCNYDLCDITDKTYTIHRHEGSWYPDILKQIFIIGLKYKYLTNILTITVVFLVIYFIVNKYTK